MVLGVSGTLTAQVVEPRIPKLDMPIMLGLAVVPLVLGWARGRVDRIAGFLLVAVYLTYVIALSQVQV